MSRSVSGQGILTKEAVDDAEQATHGADDGRDDIILPVYLQTTDINPHSFRAKGSGICHSGRTWEAVGLAEVWDKGRTSGGVI